MEIWGDLYETPALLTSARGHHRIYSPRSYARVRDRQLVPIVAAEALAMASWHPICWLKAEGVFVASVLRSLLPAGEGVPAAAKAAVSALPLILRAYPVIPHGEASERTIEFDQAIPDGPTDIGAPFLLPDGKMSKGAIIKCRAALLFRRKRTEIEALTAELAANDLLAPWPLDFDLGSDRTVSLKDLWVQRTDASTSAAMIRIIRNFGVDAASFLVAQRISLFRIASLLRAARAQARRRADPSAEATHG